MMPHLRSLSRLTPYVLAGVGLLAVLALPAWTLGQDDARSTPKPRPREFGEDPGWGANADAAREKKITEIEAKLKELLKELKALRAARPAPEKSADPLGYYAPVEALALKGGYYQKKEAADPTEVTLTRVAYKLPAGKAEALAKFLTEHVKAPVLETKVDGDSLIVTATPDYQHAVGQIVGLMLGRLPERIKPVADLVLPIPATR